MRFPLLYLVTTWTVLALISESSRGEVAKRELTGKEPVPDSVKELAAGNRRFAIDLYQELGKTPQNVFFSPESVSTALALAYAGARGQTASEMERTLHFPWKGAPLHTAMSRLQAITATASISKRDFQLSFGNALWGQAGLEFEPSFLETIRSQYDAPWRVVDFKKGAEASKHINAWIAEKTRNKISDLVDSASLDGNTQLVLANAVHMKGEWYEAFAGRRTQLEKFHSDPPRTVSMMRKSEEMKYFEGDNLQAVELGYRGSWLSMVVVLPSKETSLAAMEKRMRKELDTWVAGLAYRPVNLFLPRFKLRERTDLAATLAKLGMSSAFDSDKADFRGIASTPLAINRVLHEAQLEVDEKGSEAVAATVVDIKKSEEGPNKVRQSADFRADRPFMILIRDRRTSSILFMGRLLRPS